MPDPDIAQFTSVFRAGKPDRVQRNRQPVSCMACQRRKSRTTGPYDRSRQTCRAAALAMLEMHVERDHEISAAVRMQRGSLHGIFCFASTVVCVDLSESRDMPPAERRRCQALLTRSHDVWAARRAYSSDARHATKILRAVLKRVDGGAPVCDDTGTVTRVSSSSAGVYPATGLKPPLAAMKMDMYVPPPPPPPPPPPCVCPAQTEGSVVLVNCCAIQPQPLSLQQQGRQPPMQPPTPCRLLHPHHHHHDVAAVPATSQDMYYDLGAGGYMAMAAPDFGPASDMDTLLELD
ncbi:hypothetical protein MY5147_002294 [Beauveria neobassiana]